MFCLRLPRIEKTYDGHNADAIIISMIYGTLQWIVVRNDQPVRNYRRHWVPL